MVEEVIENNQQVQQIPNTTFELAQTVQHPHGIIRSQNNPNKKYTNLDDAMHERVVQFVIEHCQRVMQDKYGMKEVWIPEDRDGVKCNIFMSEEFHQPQPMINAGRKALVLIQGSGQVRAGIWTRRVCLNEHLGLGSMLPQIEAARNLNIPVIVMNPNYNRDPVSNTIIGCSKTPKSHATYVWTEFIRGSGFKKIDIMCFATGGSCVQEIQTTFPDSFYDQVSKIAFCDAWCTDKQALTADQQEFMFENALHYRASALPLLTMVNDSINQTCKIISAGHTTHEYTIGTSYLSMLDQFGYNQFGDQSEE